MNEERYASRIRQALNHGLNDISPAASRRLEAARHLALSKQKQRAVELVPAISGIPGTPSRHIGSPLNLPYARQIMAIAALLIGILMAACVLALVREWREERKHQRRMERLEEWVR